MDIKNTNKVLKTLLEDVTVVESSFDKLMNLIESEFDIMDVDITDNTITAQVSEKGGGEEFRITVEHLEPVEGQEHGS
jgi:prolyl oligopeptidase PreP (S9A serine peptidase family)